MLESKWYQNSWLPLAAFVYLMICCFDFVAMPIYTAIHNSNVEYKVIAVLQDKDPQLLAESVTRAEQSTKQWNPLTLIGGGLFHLAFGALLTGGAVTRGFAKKAEVDGYYGAITAGQLVPAEPALPPGTTTPKV